MNNKIFDFGDYHYIANYKLKEGKACQALFKENVPEEYCMELIEGSEDGAEFIGFTYMEDTLKDIEPDNYEDGCTVADSFVLDAINNGIQEGAVVSFDGYEDCRHFYKVYPKGQLPDTDNELKVVNLEEWHKAHIEWIDSFGPPY